MYTQIVGDKRSVKIIYRLIWVSDWDVECNFFFFFYENKLDNVVELVGGGSVINGVTLSSFCVYL